MRVQLIHPPHPGAIEDRLDPPLGLLYIASALEHDADVVVTDLTGEAWPWPWANLIQEADVYGITCYVATEDITQQIANICRKKNPEATIVVGGAHVTGIHDSHNDTEQPKGFDAYVVGDGERAMVHLLNVPPRHRTGTWSVPIGPLDELPCPAFGKIDLPTYKRTVGGQPSLPLITSRGCPFRCAFCGLPSQHRTATFRSPHHVFSEVEHIMEEHSISAFNIQDDTFTINRPRLHKLLAMLTPLDIAFRCHGRVGVDTLEDYRALRKAGCEMICWGIESGAQWMLDRMNKQTSTAQNYRAIQAAKQVGILDRSFFIIGFPGETRESLNETKRFIESADPSQVFVSTFQPYPGTDVWNHPERYGVRQIHQDFSQYLQVDATGSGTCNIDTEWLSREEFTDLEREFREWLSYRPQRGDLQQYEHQLAERGTNNGNPA